MIYRRYGSSFQSVDVDFDPRAITELQFRRNRRSSVPAEDLEASWERVQLEELRDESEGPVQSEAEQELIDRMEAKVRKLEDRARSLQEESGAEHILVVESEPGVDWPKIWDRKEGRIVEGENRLYFYWNVDPPLRIGIYRKKEGGA